MAEYQVEYTGNQRIGEQKWISFMIPVGLVHSGHYVFQSLVQDIKSRCTSLNFLNEHNMRLLYLDDEDNWINLNNDSERGFQEFWQSARTVPEREFKRIKVKAGVLGYSLNNEDSSDVLAADFVSPGKDNPQSVMYVPGQGWKSPTFEPESCQREQEAANALVELQKNNK